MTLCSSFIAPLHTQEFGLLYTTGQVPDPYVPDAACCQGGWRAEPRADDIEFESRRSDAQYAVAERSRRRTRGGAQNAGLEQNGWSRTVEARTAPPFSCVGFGGRGGGGRTCLCLCVCAVCARARAREWGWDGGGVGSNGPGRVIDAASFISGALSRRARRVPAPGGPLAGARRPRQSQLSRARRCRPCAWRTSCGRPRWRCRRRSTSCPSWRTSSSSSPCARRRCRRRTWTTSSSTGGRRRCRRRTCSTSFSTYNRRSRCRRPASCAGRDRASASAIGPGGGRGRGRGRRSGRRHGHRTCLG